MDPAGACRTNSTPEPERAMLQTLTAPRRWRRGGRGSVFLDDLRLGHDHLLAAVVAVGGDVVAQVGLARGRVGGQLLGGQRVVRTTLATAGGGNAGLLHSHGIAPERICCSGQAARAAWRVEGS